MTPATYYKHSGKAPGRSIALALVFIPFSAWLFAWAYVNAVWYIPFVFINFILTALFSVLACLPVYWAVKDGKIRNTGVATGLALLAGSLNIYIQWALWCTYIVHKYRYSGLDIDIPGIHQGFTFYLTHPGAMAKLVASISEVGTWTLSGSAVSGFPLVMVWIAEAGLTLFLGAYFILDLMKFPFSESMDMWLPEERAPRKIKPLGIPVQEIRQKLEAGDTGIFNTAVEAGSRDPMRYELALYKTSDLGEIYLSLFEVRAEVKKGKETKKQKALVKQLCISKSTYEKMLSTPFYNEVKAPVQQTTISTQQKQVQEPTKYGPPPGRPF
jgi:hypothetical protein